MCNIYTKHCIQTTPCGCQHVGMGRGGVGSHNNPSHGRECGRQSENVRQNGACENT